MRHLVIAGFDGALATAITGLMDIFALTGVTWQRIASRPVEPQFKVWLASPDGKPIQCINRLKLDTQISYQALSSKASRSGEPGLPWIIDPEREQLWAIIVPTIGAAIDLTLERNQHLLEFLRWGNEQDVLLAANCTGTFFLAEAGLLDGKKATTHWGFQEAFEDRFPGVDLQIDQLITQDGKVFCAGGGLSWFDLAIHLIEQELGYDVAVQIAKAFVIDYRRDSQLRYQFSHVSRKHQDELVANVQSYLDAKLQQAPDLESLAVKFNVSKRTLIRRFKNALNVTPGQYLQQLRIERAQQYLAETSLLPEEIVSRLGYEDLSAFRRLFKRQTGMTLAEYRRGYAKRL